jgi:hypothetical protein
MEVKSKKRRMLKMVKELKDNNLSANRTPLARRLLKTLTTKLEVTLLGNSSKLRETPALTSREDFQTLNNMRTWADFNKFNVERTIL